MTKFDVNGMVSPVLVVCYESGGGSYTVPKYVKNIEFARVVERSDVVALMLEQKRTSYMLFSLSVVEDIAKLLVMGAMASAGVNRRERTPEPTP